MKDYVSIKDHPLADARGYILRHRYELYEKLGRGPVPCHYCNSPLIWGRTKGPDELRVTYLDGNSANKTLDNMVPTCVSCLRIRTHHNPIPEGEPVFVNRNGRRSRGVARTCERCGTEFAVEASNARSNPKVGRFCSGSCRSRTTNEQYWAKKRAAQ